MGKKGSSSVRSAEGCGKRHRSDPIRHGAIGSRMISFICVYGEPPRGSGWDHQTNERGAGQINGVSVNASKREYESV